MTTTVKDFGGTVLTPVGLTSVVITTIHNPAGTEVLATQAMTYDPVTLLWFYMWNTSGLPAGTYKAKVTATGLDASVSWEWKRIRLAKDLS